MVVFTTVIAATIWAQSMETARTPLIHSERDQIEWNHSTRISVQVPEYVDTELLSRLEGVRAGFASTLKVPQNARLRFTASFTMATDESVAVLLGGDLEEREGSDTEILFRQESNFIYLTGYDHPGAIVVVGTGSQSGLPKGAAWLFVPHGDAVWQGRTETLEEIKARYDVNDVFWIEDYNSKMDNLAPDTVYTFSGTELYIPPSALHDTTELRAALGTSRAVKTDGEIEMIRAATEISSESHKLVMRMVRCGHYESDVESLFRYVGHNYGSRFQAYIPIVGSGSNAAALHYNDNSRLIPDGGLVLVDAGAEFGGTRSGGGWASDITRTWPCSGKFTQPQRAIYNAVYNAQTAAMKLIRPGNTMADCTNAADHEIITGLIDAGILTGTVSELLAARLHRVFMPHSLGHSIGLDVHDPGSITPFQPNMVLTIEPGIYFIDTLLDDALANPDQAKFISKSVLSRFRGSGGIRIEETILVTEDGYDNLSKNVPRTADDIELWIRDGQMHENSTAIVRQ